MTDHDIIEKLARAACVAEGGDPDEFRDGSPRGPYGLVGAEPAAWYAPDGIIKPWHKHVKAAQRFLAFYRAMERS